MTEHTLTFYGEELEQLKADVGASGRAGRGPGVPTPSTPSPGRDVDLAQAVIVRDEKLDTLQRDIEKQGDPHDRPAPTGGRTTCAARWAR